MDIQLPLWAWIDIALLLIIILLTYRKRHPVDDFYEDYNSSEDWGDADRSRQYAEQAKMADQAWCAQKSVTSSSMEVNGCEEYAEFSKEAWHSIPKFIRKAEGGVQGFGATTSNTMDTDGKEFP